MCRLTPTDLKKEIATSGVALLAMTRFLGFRVISALH